MLNAKTFPTLELSLSPGRVVHFAPFADEALSARSDKRETGIPRQTVVGPVRLTGWICDLCRNSVPQDAVKVSGRASPLFSHIIKFSGAGNSKKESGAGQKEARRARRAAMSMGRRGRRPLSVQEEQLL